MTPVTGTIARMELAIQRTSVATKAEKPKEVVPKVSDPSFGFGFAETQKFRFQSKPNFNRNQNRNPSF